jgi:hypothetical protein
MPEALIIAVEDNLFRVKGCLFLWKVGYADGT